MTDQQIRQALHEALDRRLSGMQEDPFLARRVLAGTKGEKPMKKKLSLSLAVALALILMASVALAAGLGVFDKLAERFDEMGETRLHGLSDVSDVVGTSVTTDDGITIDIDQCYYEGNRIFISYRESGNLYSCTRHEGTPEGEIQWSWTEKNFIAAENMISDLPVQQEDILWLNGEGQRWEEVYQASLHDGLSLADGTYLDIIGGDILAQEDGSIIGWKECEIPEEKLADELTFKVVLFRTNSIHFQDGKDYYSATTRGETTEIPFTVKQNKQFTYWGGAFGNQTYTANCEFILGQIDMRGTINVMCPEEWVKAHSDWDYHSDDDLIECYVLYGGDQALSRLGMQGEWSKDKETLCFEMIFSKPQEMKGLKLVPVYTKSGDHIEEAISLVQLVNR